MKHQGLPLAISYTVLLLVLGGCEVEESFLIVENHSSIKIVSIFVSAAGDDSWGPDQLASDVLLPGSMISFAIDPGTYDVRVVFENYQDFVYEAIIKIGLTTTVTVK